jgi:hypothetical protein
MPKALSLIPSTEKKEVRVESDQVSWFVCLRRGETQKKESMTQKYEP